jgi:hypothetical protein
MGCLLFPILELAQNPCNKSETLTSNQTMTKIASWDQPSKTSSAFSIATDKLPRTLGDPAPTPTISIRHGIFKHAI